MCRSLAKILTGTKKCFIKGAEIVDINGGNAFTEFKKDSSMDKKKNVGSVFDSNGPSNTNLETRNTQTVPLHMSEGLAYFNMSFNTG